MGSIECLARIIDSWRDSAGTLWALNAFAPLDLPARKLGAAVNQSWIIGNVDFVRNDERGTVADLVPGSALAGAYGGSGNLSGVIPLGQRGNEQCLSKACVTNLWDSARAS